ncbi:MAG: DUF3108 domain-containing protein [Pseudomonadota bacterium]
MKRIFPPLIAFILLLPAIVFAAAPSSVKATYEMYRNNILFAQIEETYTAENGKYQIDSIANPAGMLTLISKDRITRLSKGTITQQGLRPEFFEEKRTGGDKEKIRSASFDWANQKIALSFDGKTETAALEPGTQDWGSLFYQFLFITPKKENVKVTIADGKKVESYLFRFTDEMNVTTDAGKFETLHYARSDDKGERKTEIWLAKQKSFFPVRLVQEEDGKVLEQRLVALSLN